MQTIPAATHNKIPRLALLSKLLDLPPTTGIEVDLAAEAVLWLSEQGQGPLDPNPLLNPDTCQLFVNWVHNRYRSGWSYGGYLEDRTELWRGSYLTPSCSVLHGGIDVNLPARTPVRAAVRGTVVIAESDAPMVGGWGYHVVIEAPDVPYVFLYAHLGPALPQVGELVCPESLIGEIGSSPENGVWFPHLHFQVVDKEVFYGKYQGSTRDLDGYFPAGEIGNYQVEFPEPLGVLEVYGGWLN